MRSSVVLLGAVLCACATSEPLLLTGGSDGSGGSSGDGSGGPGGAPATTTSGSGGSSEGGAGGASGGGGDGSGAGSSGGCGDGVVALTEECDDANAIDGDGCTSCAIDCDATDLKEPTTGHCYRLFVASLNQPTAEANCQAWGGAVGLGHLASIGDQAENDFVAPLVSGNTWIGADDFGGAWAWIDGTTYAFENWQTGEPNHPGIEHCMFMDLEAKWHDHNCGDLRSAYLCERRGAGTF